MEVLALDRFVIVTINVLLLRVMMIPGCVSVNHVMMKDVVVVIAVRFVYPAVMV